MGCGARRRHDRRASGLAVTGLPAGDAAAIRHDFKNQLSIIRGFAEMLLADAAAGDQRRSDLEEIHKAANAALALLDRLFADPEAGHVNHPDR